MRKTHKLFGAAVIAAISLISVAADHIEAPSVQGTTADITDYYAFQGENTDNLVFVANVQGLLSPGASADAEFDENVLIEFNIDNTGDNVEDLVIQAIPRDGIMYFFGPYAPSETGVDSTIDITEATGQVAITEYLSEAIIEESNGMQFFAGPRDDPFFMDFARYNQVVGGTAPTGFNNPGADTFAGTNVLSLVVEVPKSLVGGSATSIGTWVASKVRQ